MKLGPLTKLDKRIKKKSKEKKKVKKKKKMDDDVMSENCDVVIFWIFGQFGAVRRLDSRHRVCKIYVFINSNLLS